MIWAAFSLYGTTSVCFTTTSISSENLTELSENLPVEFREFHKTPNWNFKQYNALMYKFGDPVVWFKNK